MATSAPPVSGPSARRTLPPWAKPLVLVVRIALVALLYWGITHHWFSLGTARSRMFPSIVLFVFFSIYWGASSKNSAQTKSSESRRSTIFHQILINAAYLILLFPIPGLTGWYLPPQLHYLVTIGVIVEAAGILLAIWARRHLGRNWSAAVRIGEGHELIRSGPYRFLRHPIYTGVLCIAGGIAISWGQYHALVGLAMIIAAYIRKTRLEDEILQREFGDAYVDYRRHTWGLVPLIY